jgi:glyoxylase-like metal-dependent hydrolase (beta-lactamase superfamily II)
VAARRRRAPPSERHPSSSSTRLNPFRSQRLSAKDARNEMILRQLFDADTSSYTYLLADETTRQAVLIDPVREQFSRDAELVQQLGLTLTHVLETHVHADHITSAGRFRELLGAATVASPLGAECASTRIRHGEVLEVGSLKLEALATPGHTKDSLSFLVGDDVFTGDALLVRGTGRTDFQSGDPGELYDSIQRTLFSLPDATHVWPGHDYRGHAQSTIGEERRYNPRLAGKSREEFIQIMQALQLDPQRKISEAVPANLACGHESNAAV